MRRTGTVVADGLLDVIGSPRLVAGALLLTLATAAPFAALVDSRLREALADHPPIALGTGEIDAGWWNEFLEQAGGLAATFTPAVMGFAAPLDNFSALLDGTLRLHALIVPIGTAVVAWAWFWGIVLTGFHDRRRRSLGSACADGFACLPRFLAISIAAAALQLLFYATLHAALFEVIYQRLIDNDTSEPAAFGLRLAFYGLFGFLLVTVGLVADYTRIVQVVERPQTLSALLTRGLRFVRRRFAAVLGVFALTGLLVVLLVAVYGIVDTYGGRRAGGWNGIAIGQAYIAGRLVLRLTAAAAELRLVKAVLATVPRS